MAVRTRVRKTKTFAPAPFTAGAEMVAEGRTFQVWSAAPPLRGSKSAWAFPLDHKPEDASIYRLREDKTYARPDGVNRVVGSVRVEALPYHFDGTRCAPTVQTLPPDYRRVETPCSHPSHAR